MFFLVQIGIDFIGVGDLNVVIVFVEIMVEWCDEFDFLFGFFNVDIVGWVVGLFG